MDHNSGILGGGMALQSLTERDILGGLSGQLTRDEALIGVDNMWLGGVDGKPGSGIDLFPDLLDLEQDDDISCTWMEEADVKQLLHEAEGLTADVQKVLQTNQSCYTTSPEMTSSVFLVGQLTPPESPDAQIEPEIYIDGNASPVMYGNLDQQVTPPEIYVDQCVSPQMYIDQRASPEVYIDQRASPEVYIDQSATPTIAVDQTAIASTIYLDHNDINTLMTTPLSPVDVGLILDAPLEPLPTTTTISTNPQQLLNSLQSFPPMETMDTTVNWSDFCLITETDTSNVDTIDLTSIVSDATSLGQFTLEVPTQTSFSDVSSPEPSELDDPDYYPDSPVSRKASKLPKSRQQFRNNCAKPYARPSTSGSSSPDCVDVTIIMNKKERKKMQNKNAATRYREKKREEKDGIRDEVGTLEKRNSDLTEKVEQLTREIGYMKDLMAEVNIARGKARVVRKLSAVQ